MALKYTWQERAVKGGQTQYVTGKQYQDTVSGAEKTEYYPQMGSGLEICSVLSRLFFRPDSQELLLQTQVCLNRLRFSIVNDATPLHDIAMIDEIQQMRGELFDQENASIMGIPDLQDHIENVLGNQGRQALRGFVQENDLGVPHKGPPDG